MSSSPTIDVIIPAFNEENSIRKVLADIDMQLVREVVVVNNNSTDRTTRFARSAGATVIDEPQQGYGKACLTGIAYISAKANPPELVAFLDADYSDHPEELVDVIRPIVEDGFGMVIGSRALGMKESGSMTPQQIFGNWLATKLLYLMFGARFTDLGPFRAIRYTDLMALGMRDETYGWTVEMQIKAVRKGLKHCEVPVNYRKRIGHSKISGTLKGTIMAGYKIITTLFKYWKS